MSFLLDTNFVSELMKPRSNPGLFHYQELIRIQGGFENHSEPMDVTNHSPREAEAASWEDPGTQLLTFRCASPKAVLL